MTLAAFLLPLAILVFGASHFAWYLYQAYKTGRR